VAVSYLSVPFWLVSAVLIWLIVRSGGGLLLGHRYAYAIDLSLFFLVGGAFSAAYLNIAGLFFFKGKTEWISLATVLSAMLAFLLAAPAVRYFGARGGAMAYLVTQFALLTIAWSLSMLVIPMPWNRPILAVRSLIRHIGRV
jgi:O-antigen/teichoic acid export membrane protein